MEIVGSEVWAVSGMVWAVSGMVWAVSGMVWAVSGMVWAVSGMVWAVSGMVCGDFPSPSTPVVRVLHRWRSSVTSEYKTSYPG
jgi:L-cysteine desulfidase